jgi:O-antigen/teichoic acid export membrane protein
MFRRVGVGVVDQVLSSTSNFITTVVAARYLDRNAFGAFALAIVAYTMNLLIVRALCSEAVLVRPGATDDERRTRAASVVGSAVWVGVVLGLLYVGASLFLDKTVSGSLLVLGLLTPGLLAQDTMRYVSFAQGRPRSAVVNDGFWLVSQVVVLAVLLRLDLFGPARLVAGWGLVGIAAGILQMWVDRVVPAMGQGFAWVRTNRDLSVRYLADMVSGQGASLIASYVLAGVAGVAAVGAIRGAQTLFGPVNIVLLGSTMVLVPEGRRIAERSSRQLLIMCMAAAALFAAVAAVVTVAFLVTPDDLGVRVLGSTWTGARSVIVPVGVAAMAGGVVAGALAGLRSIAAADALLRTRLLTTPAALVLPIAGAVWAGAEGLAYGVALSVWWNVLWFWRTFRRALRDHPVGGG